MKTDNKTQFQIDLEKPLSGARSLGMYNLVVTKRDMHLYCAGISPSRAFRLNEVKRYFGLKGDKYKVNAAIREMVNRYLTDGEISPQEKTTSQENQQS